MEHDPSASQATFVEISFGINVLWAAFDKFSTVFSASFAAKVAERTASIQVLEANNHNSENNRLNNNRLNTFKKKIDGIGAKHLHYQKTALTLAKLLSLLFAILCVAVVYFDLMSLLGWKLIFLLVPLPLHLISSLLIYGCIRYQIRKIASGYENFVNEFEMSPSPDKIDEDLNKLNP